MRAITFIYYAGVGVRALNQRNVSIETLGVVPNHPYEETIGLAICILFNTAKLNCLLQVFCL